MEGSSRLLAFFVLSALLWRATTVPLAVFIYVTTAILTTIPGLFTIAARRILILWVLCPFRLHVAHCASSTVLRAYVRFFSEATKASKISASLVPLKSLCIRSLMAFLSLTWMKSSASHANTPRSLMRRHSTASHQAMARRGSNVSS